MFTIILLAIKCVTNHIGNMNVSTISWTEISIMHFHRTFRKNIYYLHPESQGVARWGRGMWPPQTAESKEQQNEYFK
jgi:hypothetical protein